MDDPLSIRSTPKPKPKRGLLGFGGSENGAQPPQQSAKGNATMSNGLLSGLTGLSASWSPEEAFVAILYATALVDGEVHAKELEQIRTVSHVVKLFEKRSDADMDAVIEKVRSKITWDRKGDFPWSLVDSACQALVRKSLGATVFTNACDIIFADRTIEQAEVDLLNRLAQKLELQGELANKIIEVIKLKNGHGD